MTNIQILTIAIALGTSFLAVLTGVLLNNVRLNDVKDLLTARIDATHAELAAKIAANNTELSDAKELLAAKIAASHAELRVLIEKNHSELLLKFAEIDGRLTRIEGRIIE